jgi:hypothetical protein
MNAHRLATRHLIIRAEFEKQNMMMDMKEEYAFSRYRFALHDSALMDYRVVDDVFDDEVDDEADEVLEKVSDELGLELSSQVLSTRSRTLLFASFRLTFFFFRSSLLHPRRRLCPSQPHSRLSARRTRNWSACFAVSLPRADGRIELRANDISKALVL